MVKGQNEIAPHPRGRRVAPQKRTFWSDLPGIWTIENRGGNEVLDAFRLDYWFFLVIPAAPQNKPEEPDKSAD